MNSDEQISPATPGASPHPTADRPQARHLHEHHGHNSSSQIGVEANPDPALDYSHEHHHAHLHHGKAAAAAEDEKHEVMYARDAEQVRGSDLLDASAAATPEYDLKGQNVNENSLDTEEGGNVGSIHDGRQRPWTIRRIYTQFKPFFHLAFWMVWTA